MPQSPCWLDTWERLRGRRSVLTTTGSRRNQDEVLETLVSLAAAITSHAHVRQNNINIYTCTSEIYTVFICPLHLSKADTCPHHPEKAHTACDRSAGSLARPVLFPS